MFSSKTNKIDIETYNTWLKQIELDPKTYVVVDGFPRSGTNFLRNVCLEMIDNNLVYGATAFHFFKEYRVVDGYLHNKNVIHLFPIRNSVHDIIMSILILSGAINRKRFFANLITKNLLNKVEECLVQAVSGFKNIYFVNVNDIVNDLDQVVSIFKEHDISYNSSFDISFMMNSGAAKDIEIKNFTQNKYPIKTQEKIQKIEAAKAILENPIFDHKLEKISKLYDKLLQQTMQ